MKRLALLLSSLGLTVIFPAKALAHCPLCTGGAGAAAAVATVLGVRYGATAVFMGGFAVALGLWLPRMVKKQYVKYQNHLLFWLIYLGTILPIYPFLKGDYTSKYISMGGEYGGPLNRTYLIDMFIIGAVLGSLIVYLSPRISRFISSKRADKTIRFQGLIITFALLLVVATVIQVWPR